MPDTYLESLDNTIHAALALHARDLYLQLDHRVDCACRKSSASCCSGVIM